MKRLSLPLLLAFVSLLAAGCNEIVDNQYKSDATKIPTVQQIQTQTQQVKTPASKSESKSNCDPNYSGCVPIASDVDCAGGSGNGPAYVQGPINVIGSDIYGLDRDGNGIACE